MKVRTLLAICMGSYAATCEPATPADAELLATLFGKSLAPAPENCDDAPAAGTDLHVGYSGVRLGLVNQMLLLADAIAMACTENTSLIIDVNPSRPPHSWRQGFSGPGFARDYSRSVRTGPGRWDEVLDLASLREVMKADPRYAATRIVSPECAVAWARDGGVKLCDAVRGARLDWDPGSLKGDLMLGQESELRVPAHGDRIVRIASACHLRLEVVRARAVLLPLAPSLRDAIFMAESGGQRRPGRRARRDGEPSEHHGHGQGATARSGSVSGGVGPES